MRSRAELGTATVSSPAASDHHAPQRATSQTSTIAVFANSSRQAIHDHLRWLGGVFVVVGSIRPERDAAAREEFERFAVRVSPALLRSAYVLSGDRGHAEVLLQTTL